jgi:hypothetical protein
MVEISDIKVIRIFVFTALLFIGIFDGKSKNLRGVCTYKTYSLNYSRFRNSIAKNTYVCPPASKIENQDSPGLVCPEDISTYTDLNSCTGFISGSLNATIDEAEVARLTWEMTGATEATSKQTGINQLDAYEFNEGATTVTYTAFDRNNHSASCSFTVTISDNQLPTIENMPADRVVETDEGECTATVFWEEPAASDNCTPAGHIFIESTASPGSSFPVGATRVFYSAADAMGNESSTLSFTIAVEDREPPNLKLPANLSIACGTDLPPPWRSLQQVTAAGGYASDNCNLNETSFRLRSETPSADTCPYIITRIYEISDAYGNTATAQHLIAVEGEEPVESDQPVLKSGMAGTTTAISNGDWNVSSTWDNGVPDDSTDVIIPSAYTVNITNNAACNDITIDGTLNCKDDYILQVSGNWVNNGTYDGENSSGADGTLEFIGSNPATINGTSTTVFRNFKVNKDALGNVLEVNSDIELAGDIFLTSGLLQVNSGANIICTHNLGFTIESIAGLYINGGTFKTGSFSVENKGLLQVDSGTLNLGNSSGNGVIIRSSGTFDINGGTVNVAGRLEVSGGTADISGGTINFNTIGHNSSSIATLDLSLSSVFNMSGGTIIFYNPNGSGYLDVSVVNSTGSKNITEGNFIFGTSSTITGATFRINSIAAFNDLTLFDGKGLKLILNSANDLTVKNQLALNDGIIDASTNSKTVILTNASTSSLTRTSGYITGNLRRSIASSGSPVYNFPVGNGSNYTPLDLTFNSLSSGGTITVSSSSGDYLIGSSLDDSKSVNSYWNLTNTGVAFTSASGILGFPSGILDSGANASELRVGLYNNSSWSYPAVSSTTSASVSFTGVTAISNAVFALAECTPPTITLGTNPTICAGTTNADLTYSATTGSPDEYRVDYDDAANSAGFSDVDSTSLPSSSPISLYNIPGSAVAGTYSATLYVRNAIECESIGYDFSIILDPISVGGTIAGGTTVCSGSNSTTLTLSGYTGTIQKWQYSTDGTSWTDISNTSGTYTVTNLAQTTSYRAVVKSGVCDEVYSSESIIIVDNEKPDPHCKDIVTVYLDAGNKASIATSGIDNGSTDNCGIAGLSLSQTDFDCSHLGDNIVTLTVTDTNGNDSTCTATVSVFDTISPAFTVPGPVTINAGAACNPDVSPSKTGNVTVKSDNCSASADLNVNYLDKDTIPGNCPGNYSFTRTWTVTDQAGNYLEQDQIITIRDITKPVLTLPPTASVQCGSPTDTTVTGRATATDNCSGTADIEITYTDSIPSGHSACSYSVYRKWTATDACRNFSTATQTINVSDNTKPVILSVKDTTIQCPEYIPAPDSTMIEVSDNCGNVTITLFDEISNGLEGGGAGYCPESLTRTWRIADECGNFRDTIQMIYILEPCDCEECATELSHYWVDMMGNSDSTKTFNGVERLDRCCDYDKKDDCVSFSIRLDDDAVGVEISIEGATPTSQDWRMDCDIVPMEDGIVCVPGGEFHLFTYCKPGDNLNSYTFRSLSGVIVESEIETRVSCNTNIEVSGVYSNPVWNSISPGAEGTYNHYLYAPDSDIPESGVNVTNPVFIADTDAPGYIQYRICGQTGEPSPCTDELGRDCDIVTVFVKDSIGIDLNINPDMICGDAPTTITPTISPAGTYTLEWYSGYNASGSLLSSAEFFTPAEEGTYSVVVTDIQEGIPCSSATFNFDITYDLTGPTVQEPPAPIEIQCNDANAVSDIQDWLNSATATYTDADGTVVEFVPDNNFDSGNLNMACNDTLFVDFTAFDQCSNDSTRTSYIIIIDTIPPVITYCPPETDNIADHDSCSISTFDVGIPVYSDDCDTPVLTWKKSGATTGTGSGQASGPFNVGVTTITYYATDLCGNVDSCKQEITILDEQPPDILVCPDNVTFPATPDNCELIVTEIDSLEHTDNCSGGSSTVTWKKTGATTDTGSGNVNNTSFVAGVTTVTYYVEDAYGNKDSCSFTVTVKDVTPPEITITECVNVEETASADSCSKTLINFTDPGYSDSCWPKDSLTLSWKMTGATEGSGEGSVAGQTFNIGVTTVTYIVADPDKNKDSCQFDVTIIHLNIPTTSYTCPTSPIMQDVDINSCDAAIALAAPVINDPCNEIDSVWNNSPYRTDAFDASGTYPVGTTTFNWYITDISGNIDSCTVEVIVTDTIPPVIAALNDVTECPEFVLPDGNTRLDIDSLLISDNCDTECDFDDYTIRWRIDFADGSSLPSGSGTYNTGQLSNYGADIPFPSDSTNFTSLVHTITYWIEDCSGNVSAAQTRTVTVYPPPVAVIPADTISYCYADTVPAIPLTGYPAGDVVFDISGGTSLGINDQTGVTEIPSFWATQTGTAVITITPRANGCTGTPVTFIFEVVTPVTVSVSPVFQTICSGGTTNIHLTSSTTGATFSYSVSSVTPEGSITGASDGTGDLISQTLVNTTAAVATVVYTITAVANGCTSAGTSQATVTINPAPELIITDPDTICEPSVIDLTDAAVTAGSSSGLTFTYWTDTTATTTLANPSAVAASGTYYIKATSAAGCFAVLPVQVVINPLPELTSPLNPEGICSNTPFFYNHTSSVPGTEFYWVREVIPGISNPREEGIGYPDETLVNETSAPITVTYYYTLTANGCTNTQEVKVVVTQSPMLTNPLPPPGICSGQVFSFTPESNINPGTTFTWTRNADVYGNTSAASGTGNPNEVLYNNTENPITVTYYYTLSSNNCTNPEVFQVNVTVTPSPDVTVSATYYEICPGESIDLFSDANITSGLPTILLTEDFSGTASGWTRTPTTGNTTWTLRSDGYTYNYWWDSETFHSNDDSQFYLSNHYGTTSDITTYLTSSSISTVGYTSVSLSFWHHYQRGNNNEVAIVEYSTNGTTWQQLPNANYTSSQGFPDDFVNVNLTLPVGIETLRIRFRYRTYPGWWGSGTHYWWAIDNVSITGEPQSQAEILWTSNPSGFTSSEANPTNVNPGVTTTYTATYTDPDTNCPGSASVTVVVRDLPDAAISADYCTNPGHIILTASGGVSYLWTTGDTTQTITVDIADNYGVTVTDAHGCTATAYLGVSNELIDNGDFENGNTGFNTDYQYDANQLSSGGIPPATGGEGLYSVGTDGQDYHSNFWGHDHTSGSGNFMIVNGLGSDYVVWEYNSPIPIEPGVTYYFSAWAISLNADGNDAELRFEITYDGTTEQIGSVAHIQPGQTNNNNPWLESGRFYGNWTYNGTIPSTATVRIINLREEYGGNDFGLDDISFGTLDPLPAEIEAIAIDNNPVCEGDSIKLSINITNGKEPFTYSWTGPSGFTSDKKEPSIPDATPDNSGDYIATVTDGYGCGPVSATITVTVNPAATVNAGEDQETCASEPEVQLHGSYGGSATSATWSGGTGTFSSITDTTAVYTLSAADTAAGIVTLVLTTDNPAGICGEAADTMNIVIHPAVIAVVDTFAAPSCPGYSDGYITVHGTHGTGPYIYSWNSSPGQTSATAGALTAGTYTVTVIDVKGCWDTVSVTLNDPPLLEINDTVQITEPTCYNGSDGTATVTVISGDNPTFVWSTGDTTATVTGLSAGSYTVTVYADNWCSSTTLPVAINQPDPPSVTCPGDITVQTEYGEDYASNVALSSPDYQNDCPLVDQVWVLTGSSSDSSAQAGINILTEHDFNIGITTVTYTFVDEAGNADTCFFLVTVESAPIIDCPEDTIVYASNGECTASFDPGIPDLIQGGAPVDWTWEMTGATTGSGGTEDSDRLPDPIGNTEFNLGTTTITWVATNKSGSDTCFHKVTVLDTIPPVIHQPDSLEDCMESIYSATYDPAEDDLLSPDRPDYLLFGAGDTTLDLSPSDYSDNCDLTACPDSITWRIDFSEVTDQHGNTIAAPFIEGSGQISDYGADIQFPGDGTYESDIVHTITYYVTDCSGNTSVAATRKVIVSPRPKIVKMN